MTFVDRIERSEKKGHLFPLFPAATETHGAGNDSGIDECPNHPVGISQAGRQVIVEKDVVELGLIHHLDARLADAFFDELRRVGSAFLEPAADLLDRLHP